jgi:hypothetical protein
MHTTIRLSLLFLALISVSIGHADELVLKSGERFSTDRIWEENGKIRFNMHGLLVSVAKEEVVSIVREKDGRDRGSGTIMASRPKTTGIEENDASYRVPDSADDVESRELDRYHGRRPLIERNHRTYSRNNQSELGTGLENISWRMKPAAIQGLEKIKTDPIFGGIDQYWRPEHPLSISGAPLDGLVYGFWKDQLYSIVMWADGSIGFHRLRDALFTKYGPGTQNRVGVERYVWLEKETQRMLEYDTDLNTAIFVMRSAELDHHLKKKYPSESKMP